MEPPSATSAGATSSYSSSPSSSSSSSSSSTLASSRMTAGATCSRASLLASCSSAAGMASVVCGGSATATSSAPDPVPLCLFVGKQELHVTLGELLKSVEPHSDSLRRVNSIGLADASFVARLLESRKAEMPEAHGDAPNTDSACEGFFKSDWQMKHFRRRPAVVVLFLDRDDVAGDPQRWVHATGEIDTVREVCKPRGVQLVICVVQPSGQDEQQAALPEDRCSLLRRRGDIDAKALLVYSGASADSCLGKLCKLVRELAVVHYRECIDRIRTRIQKNTFLSAVTVASSPAALPRGTIELAIRCYIKLGFYGEYASDTNTAVRGYSTAHSLIVAHRSGVGSEKNPLQWQTQRQSVADLCNHRLCLMLFKLNPAAAVEQFRTHCQAFNDEARWQAHRTGAAQNPGILATAAWPPEFVAHHHMWMAQQLESFGKLLTTNGNEEAFRKAVSESASPRRRTSAMPTFSEYDPLFYVQAAADHAVSRRQAFARSAAAPPSPSLQGIDDHELVRGHYMGTIVRRVDGEAQPLAGGLSGAVQPISDDDLRYVICQSSNAATMCEEALELLGRVFEGMAASPGFAKDGVPIIVSADEFVRCRAAVQLKIGNERLALGDHQGAIEVFRDILPRYRAEGWEALLAAALRGATRCTEVLGLREEQIALLLERASLDRSTGLRERRRCLAQALAILGDEGQGTAAPAGAVATGSRDDVDPVRDGVEALMSLEISPSTQRSYSLVCDAGSALRTALNVITFSRTHDVKPKESLYHEVSVLSSLPDPISIEAVEFSFNVSTYDYIFVSPAASSAHREEHRRRWSGKANSCFKVYAKEIQVAPRKWFPIYGAITVPQNAQPKSSIVLNTVRIFVNPQASFVFPLAADGAESASRGCRPDKCLVGLTSHRRHGVDGANHSAFGVGTCRAVVARNDLACSRQGDWPALSTHHAPSLGVALPVDQSYNYMTSEVIVLPAAAEADMSVYLRDGDDLDPLVGEIVAVNIDITPRVDTMRNPIVLFETADEGNCGGDSLVSDAFDTRAVNRTSKAQTCTYRDGVLSPTTSLGPVEGMSAAIEKGVTNTLTFYLTWEAAATTELTVILQYTTDVGVNALSDLSGPHSARHFECEQRVTLTAIEPFHADIRFEDLHGQYTLQDMNMRADGKRTGGTMELPPGSSGDARSTSPADIESAVYLPDQANILMVTTLTCFSTAPLEILEIVPDADAEKRVAPDDCTAPRGDAGKSEKGPALDPIAANPCSGSVSYKKIAKEGKAVESVVSRGEILSNVMSIAVPEYEDVNKIVRLGRIWIRWRRRLGAASPSAPPFSSVKSEVHLPDVFVRPSLCRVTCEYDERAYVGTPFNMKIVLHNLTNLVQEYRVAVGDAGTLLYAGDRISRVTVLPRRRFTVTLVLLSTAAGTFKVPPIAISSTRFTSHMETVPRSIHVLPASMVAVSSSSS